MPSVNQAQTSLVQRFKRIFAFRQWGIISVLIALVIAIIVGYKMYQKKMMG